MKGSFTRLIAAPLATLVLISFAMIPAAEAGGGGGMGGSNT